MYNTAGTPIGWGMFNASEELQFGIVDTNGVVTTNIASINSAGTFSVGSIHVNEVTSNAQFDGNITVAGTGTFNGDCNPQQNAFSDCGTSSLRWANMWCVNITANNFITGSTNADSDLLPSGQLSVVSKTPVKTLPHIGIADADATAGNVPGAVQEGGGMNYNVLVGVLWKALQELKSEFDTYVSAHP
jgi:hypothetical protein